MLAKAGSHGKLLLDTLFGFVQQKGPTSGDINVTVAIRAVNMMNSGALWLKDYPNLFGVYERLIKMLNNPCEALRRAIALCIPALAKHFRVKSVEHLKVLVGHLLNNENEQNVRGAAYAISGIVKGLGMKSLNDYEILSAVQEACFKNKNTPTIRKQAGLFLYECLSYSLNRSFEVYIHSIIQNILSTFADPKEPVRLAAKVAMKTIMASLSGYAVSNILPVFIEGIQNENWRAKLASSEALGHIAYCAPRQLAVFLPQIVNKIREVLSDTHPKVVQAGVDALSDISSAIQNPEVADLSG